MSAERDLRYIVATATAVGRSVDELGRGRFLADAGAQAAMCWRLQTMSESARRLPDDVKDRHPEILWAQVAGLRNRLAHRHLTVDPGIIWEVATRDVPVLAAAAVTELVRSQRLQVARRPPELRLL